MRDSRPSSSGGLDAEIAVRGTPWRRLAALWRRRLRPVWREVRPVVVLTVALAVLVLGTIGFERYEESYSLLDSFYRALLLFGLGGAVEPPVPWELNVARVLGPIVTGYAAVRGLLLLSREQLQLLGMRLLLREHVVVAGLGSVGFRLARALHASGVRTVVIERDPSNSAIAGCRERGIPVLLGDAADGRLLSRARTGQARHLIVTSGEDGANIDVATAARELVRTRRRGTLTALVHLEDLELWRALQAERLAAGDRGAFCLELFNLYDSAARSLLSEQPPFPDAAGGAATAAPVLVLGLEGIGEALVLNLAGLWLRLRWDREELLSLTIAGPSASGDVERLLLRHPELESICRLEALSLDLDSPALRRSDRVASAGAVYVALADEADALSAAVSVASATRPGVPVVVAVTDAEAGVARTVPRPGSEIRPFGVLAAALTPELLLRSTTEALARAKHGDYVRSELAAGVTPDENPSLVDWDRLPESLKESNRGFARGIGDKLAAAGCGVVPAPLADPDGPLLRFTDAEVEELARLEHDRWMNDLVRDGWRHTSGPKDPLRKLHPLIVPWSELPEPERDKDRDPMRALPEMLAHAGFEIYRAAGEERRAASLTGR